MRAVMFGLRTSSAPRLRVSEATLRRVWIDQLPEQLKQGVTSIKITASSRYYLSGMLLIRLPDPDRPGKSLRGRLAFKLVGGRNFLDASRRYAVKHFVSSISSDAIRKLYAGPFLQVVLTWLRQQGFDEVCFPVHSARRRAGFQRAIEELGFSYQLRNRIIFKIIAVDLSDRAK